MRVLCLLTLLWAGSALAATPRWDPLPRAATPLQDGFTAAEDGDFSRALKQFQRAVQRDPACGVCRFMESQALVGTSRESEAAAILRALSSEHPDRYEVWVTLAEALFADENASEARKAAEMALKLDPLARDEIALRTWVTVLLRLGETDTAMASVREARTRNPKPLHACLTVLIRVEIGTVDGIDPVMKQCHKSDVQSLVDTAQARVANARGDHATVRRLAGNLGETSEDQARAASQAGDHPLAADLYRKALKKEPKNMSARIGLGIALYNMDDYDGAQRELHKALSGSDWVAVDGGRMSGVITASSEANLHLERARAAGLYVASLVRLQRTPEARSELTRLRGALGDAPALTDAEIAILAAEGKPDAAWALVHRAGGRERTNALESGVFLLVDKYPDQIDDAALAAVAWAPLSRVIYASNAGDNERCVAIVDETLPAARGEDAEELRTRGLWCASAQLDLPKAEALLAGVSDPTTIHESTWINLAIACQRAGDMSKSLQMLDRVTEPSEAATDQIRSMRVGALTDLGRLDEAVSVVETGPVRPIDKLILGVKLADESDDFARAVQLMDGLCSHVEGQNQQICRDNLQIYKELAAEQ